MGFERWTERARQVVVLAQEEARRTKQREIYPGHILLGLIREEHGLAARCLAELGITLDTTRERVDGITGTGTCESTVSQLPFTDGAQRVIDMALREALSSGNNYIGTEHVLLAIVRLDGVTALIDDPAKVRDEVYSRLRGAQTPEPTTPGTRLDQRIIDALPDLRRAAGKLQGNAEIVVRVGSRNGSGKALVVIRRGPDGEGRIYTTGEVIGA